MLEDKIMNAKVIKRLLGITASLLGIVGLAFQPFLLYDRGITNAPVWFFESEYSWYEFVWPCIGIAIILIGSIMVSKSVTAIGAIIAFSFLVYHLYVLSFSHGMFTPNIGFVSYYTCGFLAVVAAFL